jgi:hypothetical protein
MTARRVCDLLMISEATFSRWVTLRKAEERTARSTGSFGRFGRFLEFLVTIRQSQAEFDAEYLKKPAAEADSEAGIKPDWKRGRYVQFFQSVLIFTGCTKGQSRLRCWQDAQQVSSISSVESTIESRLHCQTSQGLGNNPDWRARGWLLERPCRISSGRRIDDAGRVHPHEGP